MTTTIAFQVHALPTVDLERVRTRGTDASGTPVERLAAGGGEPSRCCLRDAAPGERLILFGYAPEIPVSPYREVGPVFAHAERCDGPTERESYPADWRGRPQVLRAYDARGWIHGSTHVHDGSDPESHIEAMLADPDVEQIHSRNVAYGCYMFRVTRTIPDARA
jgi:hypothetical protein